MRSRLVRVLAAVAAVPVVLGAVSACEVKPGAAAFVGNHKYSEDDVSKYLSTTAQPATSADSTSLTPREQVLVTLVSSQLLRDYLAKNGGVPDATALTASRDDAFQTVFGQALGDEDQFRSSVESAGFTRDYATLFIDQVELEYKAIETSKATSLAELGKAVAADSPAPKVSARYGAWDASQLSLNGKATPSYLTRSTGTTGT